MQSGTVSRAVVQEACHLARGYSDTPREDTVAASIIANIMVPWPRYRIPQVDANMILVTSYLLYSPSQSFIETSSTEWSSVSPRVFLWTLRMDPNLNPNTSQLQTIHQIGAHRTDRTRVKGAHSKAQNTSNIALHGPYMAPMSPLKEPFKGNLGLF